MRPDTPSPRTSLRVRWFPLPLLLIAAAGCGDAPGARDSGADASPGATEAFIEGPDLWLAELVHADGGAPYLGEGRNVTEREGYDNQPRFLPDGTILYTRGVGERTDIWRYDPAEDIHTAVTETPDQSEYSPTPTPDGGFSAIVVEPDSLQRLWRFALDGSDGAPLFPDIAPVGYHAWLDDTRIGMFVLGDPATLQSGDAGALGPGSLHDTGIARSLNAIPGETAISYPVAVGSEFEVRALVSSETGLETTPLVTIPAQDHAWTPDGRILFGSGHRLLGVGPISLPTGSRGASGAAGAPPTGAPYVVGALPDTTLVISRLAVSDDGTSIVLVVDRPTN